LKGIWVVSVIVSILILSTIVTVNAFPGHPSPEKYVPPESTFADKESPPAQTATAETTVREFTTVRKKLVTLDKFDTRYENFSAKIDRHVLEVITSPDPQLAAQRMGMTFQADRLPIYIYLDSPDSISRLPPSITITGSDENIAVARLTLNEMNQLSQLKSVSRIGLPHMADSSGHAVSEGVSFSSATNFHNAGFDGAGVVVAVMDVDFFVNNPEIQPNIISSHLFDSGGSCGGSKSCGISAGNSHGTAVAEIVVDMAPGVSLRVYTIRNSVDFNNAVQDAINKGVDIIIASLRFHEQGGDGTTGFFRDGSSSVAKKVNLARNSGIFVTIATGNEGESHWQGTYAVSPVTPSSIGLAGYQSVMNFRSGAAGVQRACLPVLDFGDPFQAAWNAWSTTNQDYDLFLFDSGMTIDLDSSVDPQTGTQPPIEIIPAVGDIGPFLECLVLASFSSSQNHFFHIDTYNNLVDLSVFCRCCVDWFC